VVTNSSAGVVSRRDYKPFGEEIGAGIGSRTTAMGYSVADGVRQRFTSKERDNETGLDYFVARYYSSTQGRFTSADPLEASARLLNPQTWNRYTYVINNPLRLIDPDGLSPRDPFSVLMKIAQN
jgi:RHS repeat-associated protein